MLLENEVLLDAIALLNSQEDKIELIESDVTYDSYSCRGCGFGVN